MSKKNTNIEVTVEEREVTKENQKMIETVVSIAKKEIGKIVPKGNGFEVLPKDGTAYLVKNNEEGIELLIRNWNLQQ